MPADRPTLTTPAAERAIGLIIAGHPLPPADGGSEIDRAELAAAADIYRAAGRRALAAHQDTAWQQIYVEFTRWDQAEHDAAEHLLPILAHAQDQGDLAAWWFMRKHPSWRLRLRGSRPATSPDVALAPALDHLVEAGHIRGWRTGIYEAETAAFGGATAIDAVHDLFTTDSSEILDLVAAGGTGLGRRELSLLLCSALMWGAGLEWYERGDVWDRVCTERPLPGDIRATNLAAMRDSLTVLLHADTSPTGPQFGPGRPVAGHADWAAAFTRTGRQLATLNREGHLDRGLRHILSYLIIFHWNRLGLPDRTQSILAHGARHAILGGPEHPTTVGPSAATVTATNRVVADLDLDRAIAHLPLVHKGRLLCPDLRTRVQRVAEHAHSATTSQTLDERINAACAAWNLAALIAADCGIPELARELCHRQLDLFRPAWPVSGRVAIANLQPVINLARLDERAGNPRRAFDTLLHLHRTLDTPLNAATSGPTVATAGLVTSDFSLDNFLDPDRDQTEVRSFLRRVLREDGTRALVSAHDWHDAATHASTFDSQPGRLREARQTRIVEAIISGHHDHAADLIDTTDLAQPWEHAIAAILRTYLDTTSGTGNPERSSAMITAVHRACSAREPGTTVFRMKLGLSAIHLARVDHPRQTRLLAQDLVSDAARSGTAYAAKLLLDDPLMGELTTAADLDTLTRVTSVAGLGTGAPAVHLRADIESALRLAGRVLGGALYSAPCP